MILQRRAAAIIGADEGSCPLSIWEIPVLPACNAGVLQTELLLIEGCAGAPALFVFRSKNTGADRLPKRDGGPRRQRGRPENLRSGVAVDAATGGPVRPQTEGFTADHPSMR